MVNVSPGREDMARRHCSNAGLLKKNRIMAGSLRNVRHADPVSMRDENCRSRSGVVFTSSQRDAHCTLVDKYDFVFVQMLVGRNFVSWWHLLCPDDQCVRAGAEGINFENERLVPKQHPTVTFVGLKDCGRRLLWHDLRVCGRCVCLSGTWCRHRVGLSR